MGWKERRDERKRDFKKRLDAKKAAREARKMKSTNDVSSTEAVTVNAPDVVQKSQSKEAWQGERVAAITKGYTVDDSLSKLLHEYAGEEFEAKSYLQGQFQKARANGYSAIVDQYKNMLETFLDIQQGLRFNFGLFIWLGKGNKPQGMTPEQVNKFASAIRYPEQLKMPGSFNNFRPEMINCYFDIIKAVVCAQSALEIAGKTAKWTDASRQPTIFDIAGSEQWVDTIRVKMDYVPLKRLLAFLFRVAANVPPTDSGLTLKVYDIARKNLKDFLASASISCDEFFSDKADLIKQKPEDDFVSGLVKTVGRLADAPWETIKSSMMSLLQGGIDFVTGDSEERARSALVDYVRDAYLYVTKNAIITSGGIWDVDDRLMQGLDFIRNAYYRSADLTRTNSLKLQDKMNQSIAEARGYIANNIVEYMTNFIKFNEKKNAIETQTMRLVGKILSKEDMDKFKELLASKADKVTVSKWLETVCGSVVNTAKKIMDNEEKAPSLSQQTQQQNKEYAESFKSLWGFVKDTFKDNEMVKKAEQTLKDKLPGFQGV